MEPLVLGYASSVEALDLMGLHVGLRPIARGTLPTQECGLLVLRELGSYGMHDAARALGRFGWLPLPVHALVPSPGGPKPTRLVSPHKSRYPLPYDDLLRLDAEWPKAFVCPPELALMQLSAGRSKVRAAGLINQVAGSYRVIRPTAIEAYRSIPGVHVELYPQESTERTCQAATAYGLRPLTTVERLATYLDAMPAARGARVLRRALPLAHDDLASPLESQIYMLAFCSRRQGSLGMPMPLVNQALPLGDRARRFVGLDHITPDFQWVDRQVVLEANGWLYHGGRKGTTDTSLRDKAYRAQGIACYTLTGSEVRSERHFLDAMCEVADQLGYVMPKPTEAFLRQRGRLWDEMFGRPQVEAPAGEDDPGYLKQLMRYADETAGAR